MIKNYWETAHALAWNTSLDKIIYDAKSFLTSFYLRT